MDGISCLNKKAQLSSWARKTFTIRLQYVAVSLPTQ